MFSLLLGLDARMAFLSSIEKRYEEWESVIELFLRLVITSEERGFFIYLKVY